MDLKIDRASLVASRTVDPKADVADSAARIKLHDPIALRSATCDHEVVNGWPRGRNKHGDRRAGVVIDRGSGVELISGYDAPWMLDRDDESSRDGRCNGVRRGIAGHREQGDQQQGRRGSMHEPIVSRDLSVRPSARRSACRGAACAGTLACP